MAYSHYWTPVPDSLGWRPFHTYARRLLELAAERQLRIGSPDGSGGLPICKPGRLAFNGIGPEAVDPFELERKSGPRTCETRVQIYERVVMAAIILAAHSGIVRDVSSDSDAEAWTFWGLELAQAVRPTVQLSLPQGIR